MASLRLGRHVQEDLVHAQALCGAKALQHRLDPLAGRPVGCQVLAADQHLRARACWARARTRTKGVLSLVGSARAAARGAPTPLVGSHLTAGLRGTHQVGALSEGLLDALQLGHASRPGRVVGGGQQVLLCDAQRPCPQAGVSHLLHLRVCATGAGESRQARFSAASPRRQCRAKLCLPPRSAAAGRTEGVRVEVENDPAHSVLRHRGRCQLCSSQLGLRAGRYGSVRGAELLHPELLQPLLVLHAGLGRRSGQWTGARPAHQPKLMVRARRAASRGSPLTQLPVHACARGPQPPGVLRWPAGLQPPEH